jgi:hypothetical protein
MYLGLSFTLSMYSTELLKFIGDRSFYKTFK